MINKCKIICEVGASHQGNFNRATNLIDAAKFAGADFVKFQIWLDLDKFVSKTSKYYALFNKWKIPESQWIKLYNYSHNQGIQFVASVFDYSAVDLLCSLNGRSHKPFIKIASGDITYLSLIRYAALKRPVVMFSTGMATWQEIMAAAKVIDGKKSEPIPLLCTTNYPCKEKDVQLWRVNPIKRNFKVWGFSDHTKGTCASLAAVSLGAHYIEKHMDINNSPDACSVKEFKVMVKQIREVENVIGDSEEFGPLECEKEIIKIARRNPTTWLRE